MTKSGNRFLFLNHAKTRNPEQYAISFLSHNALDRRDAIASPSGDQSWLSVQTHLVAGHGFAVVRHPVAVDDGDLPLYPAAGHMDDDRRPAGLRQTMDTAGADRPQHGRRRDRRRGQPFLPASRFRSSARSRWRWRAMSAARNCAADRPSASRPPRMPSCGRAGWDRYLRKGLETWFTVLIETYLGQAADHGSLSQCRRNRVRAPMASRPRPSVITDTAPPHLSPIEAARIAAALPSPKKRAVNGSTGFVRRHGNSIAARSGVVRRGDLDSCVYE